MSILGPPKAESFQDKPYDFHTTEKFLGLYSLPFIKMPLSLNELTTQCNCKFLGTVKLNH
jgi:hypothetical protein